jgi:DNA-binding NarL/FixJ family response regulator
VTGGAGAEALVERTVELEHLDRVLDAACSGAGAVTLVEGLAGIGKTSLLNWTRRRAAARGMTVLHASGSVLERGYAMGVVRQCFESELHRHADRQRLLAGAARLAAQAVSDVPDSEEPAPGAVLHGLYWLTANIAEQAPVLITIDDAHWADEPSLLFAAYLARRIDSLAVALVIGARPPEDATTDAVLAEIRREPRTTSVEPTPLELAGVEELLRSMHGGPVEHEFARACRDATGGNPFLLGELVRQLRSDAVPFTARHADRVTEVTPPSVARTVRTLLARVAPEEQAVAHAVAVLGDDGDLDLVAELAGTSTSKAAHAVAELTQAGLLTDAAPPRFRHPLLAAATHATMSAPDRSAAHARAAALLRARQAGPERVALQLLHTAPGGDQGVVEELRDAAARAHRRSAPATVVVLLRRALAEPPDRESRAQILLDLGRAEVELGRSSEAGTHLEEAHRCAVDPVVSAQAVYSLFHARGGRIRDLQELDESIGLARADVAEHDHDLAMRLLALQMVAVPAGGERWRELHESALRLRGDTPGEAIALGHCVYPMLHFATGAEVAEITQRTLRQARALLEEGAVALVMSAIYTGTFELDRLDELGDLLDYAVAAARRRGSSTELSMAHAFRAQVHRRAGRLREAEADARLAIAGAGETGWAGGGVSALIPLVGVLIDQGRIEEADNELSSVFPDAASIPDSPATNFLFSERVLLRVAQARNADAIEEFREAVRRMDRVFGIDSVQWTAARCAAALAYAGLGDHAAARAVADQALAVARRWGVPGFVGQALHARARLEERDAAVATLQEAIAELERSPAQLEHARALLPLGALLRRRGERVESRGPLRTAYELAVACGASALAEAARTELRASGIRIQRQEITGADALTASERRIAELAAAGSSNADIAQALFLTVKTVEMHLTSAYRKLDIRSRRELPTALVHL